MWEFNGVMVGVITKLLQVITFGDVIVIFFVKVT